jgi:hypothetical protein
MYKDLKIIENFIDLERCRSLSNELRKQIIYNSNTNSKSLFPGNGFYLIDKDLKELMPLTKDSMISVGYLKYGISKEINDFNENIFNCIKDIQKEVELFFNKNISVVHGGYHLMCPGSNNNIHRDEYLPSKDGAMNYVVSHSALLYLNSNEEDYSGGEIVFPEKSISLKTKAGTLIIFTAQEPHGVTEVLTGLRDVIILFFLTVDDILN